MSEKTVNNDVKNSEKKRINKEKTVKFGGKKKVMLAFGIILCVSSLALGQIIVHDPAHMKSNILAFAKELAQHVTHLNYITEMNGQWMSKLEILDKVEIIAASKGIPIDKLGWGKLKRFTQEKATQVSAEALDDLQKIVEGKANTSDLGNLQKDLEQVFKPAPVTTAGAKSEYAIRQMAAGSAYINQSKKAIDEAQKNIKKLQNDIGSGNLRPGDLERYQVLIASYQAQIQTWQGESSNQVLRQQIAQTGLMANEATTKEDNRLRHRYEMLQTPKLFQASLKPRNSIEGVE